MPLFYFHLHDRFGFTQDSKGRELGGLDQAHQRALLEARALICEDVRTGHLDLSGRIEVVDDSGEVVLTLSFAESVAKP